MNAVKKIYFVFGFIFGMQSLHVPGSDIICTKVWALQSSPLHSVSSNSFPIITENPVLLKKLKRHFQKKSVSEQKIQEFLIKTGYYSSEIVKTKSFYVIKNPIKVIFMFKGQSFFTEKDLRKFIKIDVNTAGPQFYNFVEKVIREAYQKKSFLKVKIEKKTFRKRWKQWIYLNISEGPRIRISELKVKGVFSQPRIKYENFIRNNSTELIKRGFYNKKDLEEGYENLIHHLRSQGYLQSKIYSDRVFLEDDKAFITVNLEEGSLTLIQDIKIQNTKTIPVWEILSHIKSRPQSPLKIDLLEEDLSGIEHLYKSKGYLNIKITNREDVIQYTLGERYASIVIQIDEGSRAFVSRIEFKGLKKVKEGMVKNLLKFKSGDILTPKKKELSLQALGTTGLFTDVSLNEKYLEDQFKVSALFKERKPRSLKGGLGINSRRGFTTRAYSEIAHNNLFGWGRAFILRGTGEVNFNRQNPFFGHEFLGRYKEIFIPGYGYQGDINFSYSKNRFKDIGDDINFVRKTKIRFFINKRIYKSLKAKWNIWSFENRREACTQSDCPENPQSIGSTGFHFVWDKRDNIFDPLEGRIHTLTTEWASPFLGSTTNIAYLKMDLQNQFYTTFLKKYTLGFSIKGGWIAGIQGSQYIPASRAFILGGQDSLRGYNGNIEEERIPRKRHAPIESANAPLQLQKGDFIENVLSSYYGLLKIDFRFPVFKGFQGVFFYDLGIVSLKGGSKAVPFNESYGHSAGFGIRYRNFLIPIGLDIAFKLPPKYEEDSEYRIHFAIGW